MQKWIVPRRDEEGQWWWGYQKVYLKVLPEEEKLAWLRSMGYVDDKTSTKSKTSSESRPRGS